MKHLACALTLVAASIAPAWATPYLQIESAPIFSDPGTGANPVLGSFSTSYQQNFATPSRTLQITNTGPVPDGTPANPGLPYGFDYLGSSQKTENKAR